MNNKKYQVFISSTYIDLIDERRKILDILLMADCIPAGMESFVATDNEQFEVIKKIIDLCDYYVLIIGKRYGTINPITEISYTEMEYDYAKEQGIPVLVFSIDESMELSNEKIDNDPDKVLRLNRFRQKAMNNRLVSIWKTSDELSGKLAISIMKAKAEIPRLGWQPATSFDEASLRKEIMDLQNLNNDLNTKLKESNETIASLNSVGEIAFDDCLFTIDSYYFRNNYKSPLTNDFSLPQLFETISLQMIDVSILESVIEKTIEKMIGKVNSNSNSIYLSDSEVIKRILNQLKALNLIKSKWSSDNSKLYWGLTLKGEKFRNEMTLVKK